MPKVNNSFNNYISYLTSLLEHLTMKGGTGVVSSNWYNYLHHFSFTSYGLCSISLTGTDSSCQCFLPQSYASCFHCACSKGAILFFKSAHLYSSSDVWDLFYHLVSGLYGTGSQLIRKSCDQDWKGKTPNTLPILLHFQVLSSPQGQHNWQHLTFAISRWLWRSGVLLQSMLLLLWWTRLHPGASLWKQSWLCLKAAGLSGWASAICSSKCLLPKSC